MSTAGSRRQRHSKPEAPRHIGPWHKACSAPPPEATLSDTLPYRDRVFLSLIKRRGLDQLALRALMKATRLLGLVLGQRLAEMREKGDTTQALVAELHEQTLHVSLFQEALDVNRLRWDKLPERQRPHHSPECRFRIMRLMQLWALSHEETARIFCVSIGTIARWQAELAKDPTKRAIGSLFEPVPPVRRYADNVRHLIQAMALAGFPGDRTIAQTLARAGWKLARRTVGRIRKETPVSPPEPDKKRGQAVRARYPNHVWMADLTEVPSLFRIFSLKLAVVFDVFSRLPLAFRVFQTEPSAAEVVELFAHAACRYGAPKHFVSDQGSQFTASAFRERLETLSVCRRFGAIGQAGSIALIERLWRTLKERLRLVALKPGHLVDLDRRVHQGFVYYAHFRPHQGLGGATPAEIYLGFTPLHRSAVHPPRGRPGNAADETPFEIVYFDHERRLPFLHRKAA